MTFSKEQQKKILLVLIAAIILLNGYRFITSEKTKTAPPVFTRGAVAGSTVREGLLSREGASDPLNVFLVKRNEEFPSVARDIFRVENPAARPKSKPTVSVPSSPPPVPERTPEELAADSARADLSKFRFLGYLTEKDSSLFLSKDDELFVVKKGDAIQKSYKVKEAKNDFVILLDTATGVEVRVELPGGEIKTSEPIQQQIQQQRKIRNLRPQ